MSEEEIKDYINIYYLNDSIEETTSKLLNLLKIRQEKSPSDKNDLSWKKLSDWYCDAERKHE